MLFAIYLTISVILMHILIFMHSQVQQIVFWCYCCFENQIYSIYIKCNLKLIAIIVTATPWQPLK